MSIEDWHDAIIEDIHVNWKAGCVTLLLRLTRQKNEPLKKQEIKCLNFTKFVCPRMQPWGASNHVLESGIVSREEGCELKIQMQSGDTILVQAESIATNT